jgi:hypothetical protein
MRFSIWHLIGKMLREFLPFNFYYKHKSMKQTLTAFAFFFSATLQAQTSTVQKGDAYFADATNIMFEVNSTDAITLFTKAFNEYSLTKHYRKMNECLMAMAAIDFLNRNYISALNKLEDARQRHKIHCAHDSDGLRSIDDSIDLVQKEIDAASKSKNADPASGLN